MSSNIQFTLNGKSVSVDTGYTARLSSVLREECQSLDVKIGCNAGDCGACTVLLNGQAICACLTAVGQVDGAQVTTLDGLTDGSDSSGMPDASDSSTTSTTSTTSTPTDSAGSAVTVASSSVTPESAPAVELPMLGERLQAAFLKHGAAQCGICTPGMLVSAQALLANNRQADETAVKDALGGVLCRCTGYRKIIDAVLEVAQQDQPQPQLQLQLQPQPTANVAVEMPAQIGGVHDSVGTSIQRLDGLAKVDGTELFGDDVAPADSLVLRLLRSPYHHASFQLGDISAYISSVPGIAGVLTAADIPGKNKYGVIPPFFDQPVFAESVTRFKGEAVAAIIGDAKTMQSLELQHFPVSWTELSAELDPSQAMRDGAERLHDGHDNNVLCRGIVQCGDAQAALARAHIRVRGEFSTGFIEHAYIEPEAGYAVRDGDGVAIYGCTQTAYMNREGVAGILGLSAESVRIVPTACGGGFGSKLDLSYQPYIALAAWVYKRPVRLVYSRQESMQATTKRHPSSIQLEIGVDGHGKLCGVSFDGVFNTGAYASWGPTVANRVPIHASGPYFIRDYKAATVGVYTHSVPSGAFRGFGVPQAAVAQESLFDELANAMGIDRLDFRVQNALEDNQPTVTGQVFSSSVGIKACLEALRQHWRDAQTDARYFNEAAQRNGSAMRRGIGVASGWYGCGNTSMPNPSTIKAGIRPTAEICLHQGAIDIGQGSNTVVTQVFAAALGVPVTSVTLLGSDTAMTPDAGKTSASRQTFVSGNAAKLSGLALRDEIARLTNCQTIHTLAFGDGAIHVNEGHADAASIQLADMAVDAEGYVMLAQESYDPPTRELDANGQGDPYALFGYAAQMAVLDVDTRLGTVKLQNIIAAHDVGKAINPLLVEGQIQGGVAQGIGLALMEEYIPGRTENLHDYLIPTIGDVPPITSLIVEVPDTNGPFGAKGLGEHVLIPTAPAILNAIHDASGGRVTALPATPDKVMTAINAGSSDAITVSTAQGVTS